MLCIVSSSGNLKELADWPHCRPGVNWTDNGVSTVLSEHTSGLFAMRFGGLMEGTMEKRRGKSTRERDLRKIATGDGPREMATALVADSTATDWQAHSKILNATTSMHLFAIMARRRRACEERHHPAYGDRSAPGYPQIPGDGNGAVRPEHGLSKLSKTAVLTGAHLLQTPAAGPVYALWLSPCAFWPGPPRYGKCAYVVRELFLRETRST